MELTTFRSVGAKTAHSCPREGATLAHVYTLAVGENLPKGRFW